MLFNSFEFLVFLPIVFLLYWFVFGDYCLRWLKASWAKAEPLAKPAAEHRTAYAAERPCGSKLAQWWTKNLLMLQNLFIVVVSYVFYGWWNWRFLVLIALTSFCSWLSGVLIGNAESAQAPAEHRTALLLNKRKVILWANIILNLGILGFFKYFNFFVQSFVDAFATFGITLHASTLNIILPVGISFYTFQALSYSIDVYKGKIPATKDIVAFFAYVGFFPLLVAGPIERAQNLLVQFQKPRTFDYNQAVDGCRQMLWGFFKKIVIADNCAVYVNQVFDSYQDQSGSTLLLAAIFFTFQIYGDFSGYSDIAIGCSKLFGITAMQNFRMPYFSRDIAEFWRRWHISLTTWFRDYIYIPLGGSRTTKAKVIRNTFIIFLVSGFWHGANWTFIAWGAYHACLFMPLLLLGKNRKNTSLVAQRENGSLKLLPTIREAGQMLLTFSLAVLGWIIFRADNISQFGDYMMHMCDASLLSIPYLMNRSFYIPLFVLLIVFILFEWLQRDKQHALEIQGKTLLHNGVVRYMVYIALMLCIFEYGGEEQIFVYFQF